MACQAGRVRETFRTSPGGHDDESRAERAGGHRRKPGQPNLLVELLAVIRQDTPARLAAVRVEMLKRFVAWGLTAGQAYGLDLGYIALRDEVAPRALAALERIN